MRQINGEIKKEKILQAATEVFAEEGFFKAPDSLVKMISKCVLNSENNEDIIRIRSFMGGLLCYVVNPHAQTS